MGDSTADDFALHSWVDESMLTKPDVGLYILAAVVCDPAACDSTRDTLRLLRYKRQTTLHWRDEDQPRRAKLAAAIGQIDMAAVVVVGAPMQRTHQERARRKCMETLLMHLGEMGVEQVWLENRTSSLNKMDRQHLGSLRRQQLIPNTLRVDVEKPSVEPMLWMPDIVAGAVGADRTGDSTYLDLMRQTVTELEIQLQ